MTWTIIFILIGAAIHFGIGMVYYSQLFGEQWAEAYGFNKEDLKPTPTHFGQAAGVALLVSLGLCYLVSGFGATDILSGATIGFFSWLFLIVPTQYSGVIWTKRPLNGYLIDMGAYLVSFVILGAFFGIVH